MVDFWGGYVQSQQVPWRTGRFGNVVKPISGIDIFIWRFSGPFGLLILRADFYRHVASHDLKSVVILKYVDASHYPDKNYRSGNHQKMFSCSVSQTKINRPIGLLILGFGLLISRSEFQHLIVFDGSFSSINPKYTYHWYVFGWNHHRGSVYDESVSSFWYRKINRPNPKIWSANFRIWSANSKIRIPAPGRVRRFIFVHKSKVYISLIRFGVKSSPWERLCRICELLLAEKN